MKRTVGIQIDSGWAGWGGGIQKSINGSKLGVYQIEHRFYDRVYLWKSHDEYRGWRGQLINSHLPGDHSLEAL